MKKKVRFELGLVLALGIVALPLAAQNTSGQTPSEQTTQETPAFVPHVSRLQGEVRNNLVRLSWTDSQDARGPVYIYRSTLPPEGPNLVLGARPVVIPYGVQSYVDEIEVGGTSETTLYYFAAASDETGRRYDVPVAPDNTISIQIPADSSAYTPSPQEKLPENLTGIRAGITSVGTAVQGDGIIISFTEWPENSGENGAALYRSIQPIKNTPDLLGAVIVQTGITSPFTDYPVPGIPYYYAVVAEEDLIRGTVDIIPGRNATLSPAQVSADPAGRDVAFPDRDIRAMPLPEISVEAAIPGMDAYAATPPPTAFSPQAAKALEDIPVQPPSNPALKKPRMFPQDTEAPGTGGEEYALALIVKGSFTAQKWEAARDELVRFLALPRSPEVKARATFYLGQCYYFLNQNREAFFEFLAIRDRYPAEAAEWIQASLDRMAR